jgi:hypothetical protein
MNGRVYDYNLGRFLSVDPFIQDPGNSQSMNPYSYIMNNPLSGTDPSGYTSCKEAEAGCKKKSNRARGLVAGSSAGGTSSAAVALNNGNIGTVTIKTNKAVKTENIGEIKMKDIDTITVGSEDGSTVYTIHQTGGTSGNTKLVDQFISNNVTHTTEHSSGYSAKITPVPKELRQALIEMTKNSVGLKIINYYTDNDIKLEMIDTSNYRTSESGMIGNGFVGDDTRGSEEFGDAVFYNLDLKGFRNNMSSRAPFMNKNVIASYTFDVLLVAEFGHTSASSAFGLDSKGAYDEIISHATVENAYRSAVNKPLRRSYSKRDDIHDYMNRR